MSTWEPLLERMVGGRYPQLVAYAMRMTPSRADAEDLVQDALVATFSGRARFATEAEAEAYVRQAVASRFIDTGRRRSTERRALERHVGQTPVEDVPPPSVGLAPEVEAALALLAPRERACVVLRHMEDLSTRETAQLLHLSEGAVKRYLSDGVAALTAALGTELAEREPEPEIGQAMWGAVDADAKTLDGLAPAPDELASVRSRVRRGRTVRHVREVAVAIPVVVALVVAGWFGIDRLTQTPPAEETPTPVQPTPDRTPSPTPTSTPTPDETDDVVLGDPIDEPSVPTYYAMPDGLLDTVGAGWVLATYAPRMYVEGESAPSVELVFLISPEGTRFLVARLDPGVTSNGGAVEWTEHELLFWRAGETVATLRDIRLGEEGGGEQDGPGAVRQLDLATGQLSSAPDDGIEARPGLSPDGTMALAPRDEDNGVAVQRLSDGATVAELPMDSPAGWCQAVTWWTADSILAACADEDPTAVDRDGIVTSRNPRLVVLPLADLGSGRGTTLRTLAEGDPWPNGWDVAAHVSDGVVAWPGTELSADVPLWVACPTGVYLQTGDRIERLPASSDDRVELNIYTARAVDGGVYVDATGGCSGDMRPSILTRYDVATGTTTELVPPPPGMGADQWWLQGLSSYVVAR